MSFKFITGIMVLAVVVGCKTKEKNITIGGNKDAHGCLTSAGYTWSELQKKCVRPFEVGIALIEVNPKENLTTASYLILNKEMSSAELFTPLEKNSIILHKGEHDIYKNSKYELSKQDAKWVLKIDNVKSFEESKND